jgi:protein PhnA
LPSENLKLMSTSLTCPECKSPYGYMNVNLASCPECGFDWDPSVATNAFDENIIVDANGTILQDGDTVIVIKDLPVKGASNPVKMGTKVKNIKLTDGDHNIACKIDGFGAMGLKSEFVRKA